MTITMDQFQKEVHDFQTFDEAVAIELAEKYNAEGIEDDQKAVVQGFGGLGYCLILSKAADAIKEWDLT